MAETANEIEYQIKILEELNTILSSEDDEFIKFDETKKIVKEVSDTWAKQQETIKDCIIGMTSLCDNEEEKLREYSSGEQSDELRENKNLLVEQQKHQETIKHQVKDLLSEKEQGENEKENLEKERERVENSTTRILPTKRYDVSLYHNITGIRWQYDCPPEEVKGLISSKKKVETFELNKQQNSQFFIANHLWDLIERTHQK